MSIRLHIIVEGQTEETFVREILADHLGQFNISTAARSVETGRGKAKHVIYRGGLRTYQKVKKDLTLWMKGDQNADAYFTTMLDLYALPDDFPAFERAKQYISPYDQVRILEEALLADNQHPRFIPYIQLHEYEALLFSDPTQFDWEFIDNPQAIQELIDIASSFVSPELINDTPENAPSKRIIKIIPEYEGRKSSAGPLIAQKIGITVMRSKCPHFDEWLQKLESLAT